METLRFAKVRDVKSPERGTAKSAGIDFFVPNDFPTAQVQPGDDLLIPSGIRVNIPEGYMLLGADKSGVATTKQAVVSVGRTPKISAFMSTIVIGAKIIDEDFQGELHIHIINVGNFPVTIKAGMKISQFILVPVDYCALEEVPEDQLFEEASERDSGCFGSTDISAPKYQPSDDSAQWMH